MREIREITQELEEMKVLLREKDVAIEQLKMKLEYQRRNSEDYFEAREEDISILPRLTRFKESTTSDIQQEQEAQVVVTDEHDDDDDDEYQHNPP